MFQPRGPSASAYKMFACNQFAYVVHPPLTLWDRSTLNRSLGNVCFSALNLLQLSTAIMIYYKMRYIVAWIVQSEGFCVARCPSINDALDRSTKLLYMMVSPVQPTLPRWPIQVYARKSEVCIICNFLSILGRAVRHVLCYSVNGMWCFPLLSQCSCSWCRCADAPLCGLHEQALSWAVQPRQAQGGERPFKSRSMVRM